MLLSLHFKHNLSTASMEDNDTSYKFNAHNRMILGISEVAANAVSVVLCSFVILIIVTYKKYQFSYQRLLLYLTINSLIYSIVHILQGASYSIIDKNEKYCQTLGCLFLLTKTSIRVSLVCIILELYLCILKKDTVQLKWCYFAAIYLMPASMSWIPFAFKKFGFTGIQCYIIQTNGLVLMAVLDWLPLSITYITTGPFYWFLLYRLRRQGKQYTPLVEVTRNTIYQETIKDLGYFKYFPLLFFIIDIPAYILRGTTTIINNFNIILWSSNYVTIINNFNIILWSSNYVILGLQNGAITLIGVLDPKTRNMLNWNSFKEAWHQNILGRNVVETYPITKADYGDSVQDIPINT